MIEIREDQVKATVPASGDDIQTAIANELNKRIELLKAADVPDRMKTLQAEMMKSRAEMMKPEKGNVA